MPSSSKKRVLIVVRTYPTPARKGVEVSCTAGITDAGEWIRLFPVPYRFLSDDKRFHKYQWVDVEVVRAPSDARPESHRLVSRDAISIVEGPLSTDDAWRARKDIVLPLRAHCLCCLERARAANEHPTLGLVRPRSIRRLLIEPDDPTWDTEQLAILRQPDLFDPPPDHELEKIPFLFRYEFWCDDQDCNGHTLACTDWEMAQSWRDWRRVYGNGWEEKFRERYESDMISKKDTHFFVGTHHRFKTWMIIGVFYPPVTAQGDLFGPN